MKIPELKIFTKPLDNAADEISSKFKTPIFTTYIAIWIIRNNSFVYDLFFNSNITDKTTILSNQFNFSNPAFYWQTLYTIIIALVVLIIYYLLTNLSRAITIFSEERVRLHILTKLKSKTVGSMEDINYWREKARDFEEKNNNLESNSNILRSTATSYQTQKEKAEREVIRTRKVSEESMGNMRELIMGKVLNNNTMQLKVPKNQLDNIHTNMTNILEKHKNELRPVGHLKV